MTSRIIKFWILLKNVKTKMYTSMMERYVEYKVEFLEA